MKITNYEYFSIFILKYIIHCKFRCHWIPAAYLLMSHLVGTSFYCAVKICVERCVFYVNYILFHFLNLKRKDIILLFLWTLLVSENWMDWPIFENWYLTFGSTGICNLLSSKLYSFSLCKQLMWTTHALEVIILQGDIKLFSWFEDLKS